jgi:hypothetical protein
MGEEIGVAACRFFVRQVCVSHIGGLIVIPFNGELTYRHVDMLLLSARNTGASGSLGGYRGRCCKSRSSSGRTAGRTLATTVQDTCAGGSIAKFYLGVFGF